MATDALPSKLIVPALSVPTVEAPVTVVVPPEIEVEFNAPAATVPPVMEAAVKSPPTDTLAVLAIVPVNVAAFVVVTLPADIPVPVNDPALSEPPVIAPLSVARPVTVVVPPVIEAAVKRPPT